jgi:hypothetical protein
MTTIAPGHSGPARSNRHIYPKTDAKSMGFEEFIGFIEFI